MKISLKVIPNAKQNEVVSDEVDLFGVRILKVKVSQPPEDGKANKAVIELLAEYFKVRKNAISIITGESSRNKIIEIETG
jgi:uncharacterized protein (TIGR00251 family)